MTKRASATAATRRRIVQATLDLHAEKGIAATSWDDIAARAGVGVGTVYRHFRNHDELLPACGEVTWLKLELPTPDIFAGTEPGRPRLKRLVEALFALYERGEAELRNIREEALLHPIIADANAQVEDALDALVDAAADDNQALVRALTDLGTWQSLRARSVGDPVDTIVNILLRV